MATPLVGNEAPDFTATAVWGNNEMGPLSLSSFRGRYVVLFFYPLDFTFVCPSELIAFDHRLDDFTKRNVEVIGCSIDSQFTHLAWKNTAVSAGGIGQVRYPLVADLDHSICRNFGVENAAGIALRGTFLIDRAGVIQHQVVNNLALGRDVDELLRVIDALQFTEEHGEVCPAGWRKGRPGMQASPEGVARYLADHASEL